jgi:uncharacterized protein Usg
MTSNQQERLEWLKEDMNDDLKSWKEAEAQLIEAKEWRDKMALNYANSVVKFYNAKNND